MAKNSDEIYFTEMIEGVKIEYLTNWDGYLGRTISTKEGVVKTEDVVKGYGKKCASLANEKGFKRVQIGTLGEFYYMNTKSGVKVALDSMFMARFLKR